MPTNQRILFPIDLNESTHRALTYAREIASRSPTEVYLLHIIPMPRLPLVQDEDSESRLRGDRQRLERMAQPLLIDGLTVVCEVRSGRPAREIVAYAREKDIHQISMTTHGRTGLAHAVLGSVAEQVIRHAPCPVLILPSSSPQAANDRARLVGAGQVLAASFGSKLTGPYEET